MMKRDQVDTQDRGTPTPAGPRRLTSPDYPIWAQAIALAFSVLVGLALLVLPAFSLVSRVLVVDAATASAAVPLLIVGLAIAAGAAILHFARLKALHGYELHWPATSALVATWLGALVTAVLAWAHPLLAIGPVATAGLCAVVALMRRRLRYPRMKAEPALLARVLAGVEDRTLLRAREYRARLAMAGGCTLAGLIGTLLSLAIIDGLVAAEILAEETSTAAILTSLWAITALGAGITAQLLRLPRPAAARVEEDAADPDRPPRGLSIRDLCIDDETGSALIAHLSLDAEPGHAIGLVGPSGSGKSLLMQAIANPFLLHRVRVHGSVLLDGTSVWSGGAGFHSTEIVHAPARPITLDAPGVDNISCGVPDRGQELARLALEDLFVFGNANERILAADNARELTPREQQLSALARAFLLAPGLYLLDLPETALTRRDIGRLKSRISAEITAGRTVIMCTNDQQLLECCDTVLVMNDGHVTDRGPRQAVLMRQQSGRARLMLDRSADEEDRLHNWLRSQFNRPGDERNRRNVCLVASEALALPHAPDRLKEPAPIIWEFQHQKGHCILEMSDQADPISPTVLKAAQDTAVASDSFAHDTPIANLLRRVQRLEQITDGLEPPYQRKIRLIVETYDPRQKQPVTAEHADPADTKG